MPGAIPFRPLAVTFFCLRCRPRRVPAGDPGKPLAAKLDVKPGHRMLLVGAPAGFEATLGALPEGACASRGLGSPVDIVHAFVTRRTQLEERLGELQARVREGGQLWVSWPKRASGVATDLTEEALRDVVLPTGWVDTKVCAVDNTWSALKFMRRVRPSDKPGRPTAREVEGRRG